MATIFVIGCREKSRSKFDQQNVQTDNNTSIKDTPWVKSWEDERSLVQQKINGKWHLEEDNSQIYEIVNDSLYERTELGVNGYKYTIEKFGVINGDTIKCSKNEYFISYYRHDTLQFSYVIINITDTTLSLMSPSNAQVAIYKRNNPNH